MTLHIANDNSSEGQAVVFPPIPYQPRQEVVRIPRSDKYWRKPRRGSDRLSRLRRNSLTASMTSPDGELSTGDGIIDNAMMVRSAQKAATLMAVHNERRPSWRKIWRW